MNNEDFEEACAKSTGATDTDLSYKGIARCWFEMGRANAQQPAAAPIVHPNDWVHLSEEGRQRGVVMMNDILRDWAKGSVKS